MPRAACSSSACARGCRSNTRLVEVSAGIDLVEAQLRVAAGERLPNEVRRAQPAGHALQARVSAAPRPDDAADEGPAIISALRWPTLAPGALRVDTDLVRRRSSGARV